MAADIKAPKNGIKSLPLAYKSIGGGAFAPIVKIEAVGATVADRVISSGDGLAPLLGYQALGDGSLALICVPAD